MTKDRPKNMAGSVHQRLINKARELKEDFNFVLIRYALERLLYRLSQSPYRNHFILKGAMLFQIWSGQFHRSTRDLDLLGKGTPSPQNFKNIFCEICNQDVENDGLDFLPGTVRVEQIKEDEEYQGLRLKFEARLSSARIPIQVDIGFGDAVTPEPSEISYPALLDFPAPTLKAYPREAVIAEKFQAMVKLGIANSRMKDFYDIWVLSRQFDFSGTKLCTAIQATFNRRKTALPKKPPFALTSEFSNDSQKLMQWRAFVRKSKLDAQGLALTEITECLMKFLMPPTEALSNDKLFEMDWSSGGPWRSSQNNESG